MIDTTLSTLYTIRRGVEADLNFIANSWIESYRKSDYAKYIPKYIYNTGHNTLVKQAISRSIVHCAVDKEDSNQIFGWVCVEPGSTKTLHYVYVKHSFRELGIGSSLIESSQVFSDPFLFSHLTKTKLNTKLFQDGKYDPYKFFKGDNND